MNASVNHLCLMYHHLPPPPKVLPRPPVGIGQVRWTGLTGKVGLLPIWSWETIELRRTMFSHSWLRDGTGSGSVLPVPADVSCAVDASGAVRSTTPDVLVKSNMSSRRLLRESSQCAIGAPEGTNCNKGGLFVAVTPSQGEISSQMMQIELPVDEQQGISTCKYHYRYPLPNHEPVQLFMDFSE